MGNWHAEFIERARYRLVTKHTILHREGELCDTFVFLKSGVLRHYFVDNRGDDITKNILKGPGYLCYSFSSFVSRKPGIIQCDALSELELYELSHYDFCEMLTDPEFSAFWHQKISSFILKKEKKELSLIRDDAKTRYLAFLEDYPGLINEIPHFYIASFLSISPETLSRIRKSIS